MAASLAVRGKASGKGMAEEEGSASSGTTSTHWPRQVGLDRIRSLGFRVARARRLLQRQSSGPMAPDGQSAQRSRHLFDKPWLALWAILIVKDMARITRPGAQRYEYSVSVYPQRCKKHG
jgi:hypothetical protein